MEKKRTPAALEFKPDLAETTRRWNAYYAGDIIDRPIVLASAPKKDAPPAVSHTYHDLVFGDMDKIIGEIIQNAAGTYYGGETVPACRFSFGPDEVAVFCGTEFQWDKESGNTNWSTPFIEDWKTALPLALKTEHPLFQRQLEFYRRAAARVRGKMVMGPIDLHTNMDLLAAARGPQQLCLDLLDEPELIDRAMADARAVFPQLWKAVVAAGRMDELGYWGSSFSMEGAAILQCDFSCMVSPAMFRRWILPALEEEAALVKHAFYHWDGPGALIHENDLVASRGLHTLSYVPGAGHGGHPDYLEIYKRIQKNGKAVFVWGSPDELKRMHRELRPEKTVYLTWLGTPAEVEDLLQWFVKNT
jgi:5-methyltetrahydrofolate--homocysteine methyltransferase